MEFIVPFVHEMGIEKKDEEHLKLACHENVTNHIRSIHAGALFTLAETQSGFYLESIFSSYKGTFIPLLRASSVKYKMPATTEVYAIAEASKESLEKFETQYLKKGRASITVSVELRDIDEVLVMLGEFSWFVQRA